MPSIRQLLALHPVCLVVDTCSTRAEAVLWRADRETRPGTLAPLASATEEGEASAALPIAVARLFAAAGDLRIRDLDAVAFCAGPGSVLGVRLAAATLRTWRAVRPDLALYSYHSLPLLAVGAANPAGETIVADARRDTWHVVRPAAPHELLRLPSAGLAACSPLATPENFRRWSALPSNLSPRPLPYRVAELLEKSPDEPFFNPAPDPDAFLHEQPTYVAWNPRIHQAPAPGFTAPVPPER